METGADPCQLQQLGTGASVPLSLAEWRARLALSLSELGVLVRLDRKTVWRIEHGLQRPYPASRRRLAAALDVELDQVDCLASAIAAEREQN